MRRSDAYNSYKRTSNSVAGWTCFVLRPWSILKYCYENSTTQGITPLPSVHPLAFIFHLPPPLHLPLPRYQLRHRHRQQFVTIRIYMEESRQGWGTEVGGWRVVEGEWEEGGREGKSGRQEWGKCVIVYVFAVSWYSVEESATSSSTKKIFPLQTI